MMTAHATIGTTVKTQAGFYGESSHITTIKHITTNELGTTIYVMANGQRLGIDEFKKY